MQRSIAVTTGLIIARLESAGLRHIRTSEACIELARPFGWLIGPYELRKFLIFGDLRISQDIIISRTPDYPTHTPLCPTSHLTMG